jgi:hypothetical protein
VTREECRVVSLPSDKELNPKLHLYHELLSAAPGADAQTDPELLVETGGNLGTLILGDLADLLERSNRIIVSPDGSLNLIPFDALLLATDAAELGKGAHEAESGTTSPESVGQSREWVRVPSASVLAWQRMRIPLADSLPGLQILAVAARETESGQRLAGAVDEVRALERHYEGVDAQIVSGEEDSIGVAPLLVSYDLLHFAAHVELDDQYPWHSRIHLSRTDPAANLRADRIVGMKLPARLAVLSGCESAGGRIRSGEGVQGLCGAFMSAGVPAVIATLWPRTTAVLMERFYEGLNRGEEVAASLRNAQLLLKQDERTRDPFYWAGFVLVGDGEVRIPLEKRRETRWALLISALVLVILSLLVRSRLSAVSRPRPAGS